MGKPWPRTTAFNVNLCLRLWVRRSVRQADMSFGDSHAALQAALLQRNVNGGENMYRRGGVKLHQGLRR